MNTLILFLKKFLRLGLRT